MPPLPPAFESDVISDGTQTLLREASVRLWFESDVISDGTQTANSPMQGRGPFESDVISDGTQTELLASQKASCLRVM